MQIMGDGCIEKVGKNKHRVRFNLGYDPVSKKYRHSPWRTVRGTKEDARRERETYRRELEDGLRVDMSGITFLEYTESFQETRAALSGLALSTIETEMYQIKLLVKYLGGIPIRNIDSNIVKKAFVRLVNEDGISKTRLHDITVKAKQIFECAVDDRFILVSPMRKIRAPQRSKPNRNSLNVREAQTLLEVLDALPLDRNVVAVYIGLATGLRRGEALALRWHNVDLDNLVVRVSQAIDRYGKFKETKTGNERKLAIDAHTAEKLSEWKKLQTGVLRANGVFQTDETVVCATRTDGTCSPARFTHWFESFCIRHHFAFYVDEEGMPLPEYRCNERGVEVDEQGHPFSRMNKKPKVKKHYCGLKYHELRHTQATLLLAHGVPLKTVQERLGHKDATTTLNIYGHALPEQDHEAATLFRNLLAC